MGQSRHDIDEEVRSDADRGGAISDGGVRRLLEASLESPPVAGEQVGPFELVELIGQGGFGEVYHAVQREPVEREVAVKILSGRRRGRGTLDRFERERQILASLRHPGIVRLLQAGVSASGYPWFAMDLVTGRTIDRWVDEREPSLELRLDLLRDLSDAVAAAHRRGVTHRDLKPSNILVQETLEGPKVLVVDFGIAKAAFWTESANEEPGRLVGTPEFMSPEATSLDPDRIDARSDVYALGLVAHRVLSGRSALACDPEATTATRLERAARPRIEPLATACQDRAMAVRLRGDVQRVVSRCLEVEPDRRYASAAELAAELADLLDRRGRIAPLGVLRGGSGDPIRRRRLAIAIVVAAIAVAAIVVALIAAA